METKNQRSGLTNGPFNLAVDCGAPGWSYVVVGYTANLVRATPATTLTALGADRYDVTFPGTVSRCAYLATVGDPGNGLVFNPNGVCTGSGPNARTVYIETKNIGGGLSADIPFHLAVICPQAANATIAVVSTSGLPARGSPLTSSFRPSAGQYTLVTSQPLQACAVIATRDSARDSIASSAATWPANPSTPP